MIGKAEIKFHQTSGMYTDSLIVLPDLTSDLRNGAADGHRFAVLSASREAFVVQSVPIDPGRTGNQTCKIDQSLAITC